MYQRSADPRSAFPVIVVRRECGFDLVTQSDHAALAADLLAVWPALEGNRDRDLLLRATRLHDNGWQEVDSAPHVDGRGHPLGYRDLPAEDRRELWRRGIARYRDSDPECALLIALHAIALHRQRDHSDLAGLVDEAALARDELVAELGDRSVEVVRLYGWLALADTLSLMSCERWTHTVRVEQPDAREPFISASVDGLNHDDAPIRLHLDPFPLVGATTFHMAKRTVPDTGFSSSAALAGQLAEARWQAALLQVQPDPQGPLSEAAGVLR